MAALNSLRIIGPHPHFRYFLPPRDFSLWTSQFLYVARETAAQTFAQIPPDGGVTVIVQPDAYSLKDLDALQAPKWLWFLGRFAPGGMVSADEAPVSMRQAEEEIAARLRFLGELDATQVSLVVVSDEESRRQLSATSHNVVLSPPPVMDDLSIIPETLGQKPQIIFAPEKSMYATRFMNRVNELESTGEQLVRAVSLNPRPPLATVVIGSGVIPSFPYSAAVSVMAGIALFTNKIQPTWGLEPGIDYFEVSSPDELFFSLEAFVKGPEKLKLMTHRARAKASVFRSSTVWESLIGRFEP